MSDFATDTFTDTEGTDLLSHTPELGVGWISGGGGTATIHVNRATCGTVSGHNTFRLDCTVPGADYTVEAACFQDSGGGTYASVAARLSSDCADGYLVDLDFGDNKLHLYKLVAGTTTQIGVSAATFTLNYLDVKVLKLTCAGTTITVNWDGADVISVTDATHSAAGFPGIVWFANPGAGTAFDEFHAYAGVGGGGTLTISKPSIVTQSNTAVSLSVVVDGGNAPVVVQWYRSTSSGFTPGGGNILSGATSADLVDTTASSGVTYFYKCVATDSSGTPVVAISGQTEAQLAREAVKKILFIGDSITNGGGGVVTTPPYTLVAAKYAARYGSYLSVYNAAVNGTKTADWVSGSDNLNAAEATMAGNGITTAVITLGTNDAISGVSDGTYLSNLTSCVNRLTGLGATVILNDPTPVDYGYYGGSTHGYVTSAFGYRAQIAALVNGTTVLRGDQNGPQNLLNGLHDNITNADSNAVHLTVAGNDLLADGWTAAIYDALHPQTGGGSSGIVGSGFLGF